MPIIPHFYDVKWLILSHFGLCQHVGMLELKSTLKTKIQSVEYLSLPTCTSFYFLCSFGEQRLLIADYLQLNLR